MNQSRMDVRKENQIKNSKKVKTTNVLYQKMGDRWFTFVVINDEAFVGTAPQSVIEEKHPSLTRKTRKVSLGNET